MRSEVMPDVFWTFPKYTPGAFPPIWRLVLAESGVLFTTQSHWEAAALVSSQVQNQSLAFAQFLNSPRDLVGYLNSNRAGELRYFQPPGVLIELRTQRSHADLCLPRNLMSVSVV